jgi:hypothetical protein
MLKPLIWEMVIMRNPSEDGVTNFLCLGYHRSHGLTALAAGRILRGWALAEQGQGAEEMAEMRQGES